MSNLLTTAERYKEIYFISDDDIHTVREAGKIIDKEKETVFDLYLAWMDYHPDYKDYFTTEVMAAVEKMETEIWIDFTQAPLDNAYVKRQQKNVLDFREMGLPFEVYLSAILALHELIEDQYVRAEIGSFELLRAFKKIAGIGLFIAIDTHNDLINRTIKEQNQALMEMSTPVTQLWNGILFLPLVGIIDSRRAQDVMTAMLSKIAETQSKVFIMDISGIAVVDTAVANYLIKITKATKLMGCHCIISGISGSVAQTVVELGIQTNEVATTGNMQDAIETAFNITGATIGKLATT